MCSIQKVYEWNPSECKASVEVSGFGFKFRRRWMELEKNVTNNWSISTGSKRKIENKNKNELRSSDVITVSSGSTEQLCDLTRLLPIRNRRYTIDEQPLSLDSAAVHSLSYTKRSMNGVLRRPKSVEALCRRSLERNKYRASNGRPRSPSAEPRRGTYLKKRDTRKVSPNQSYSLPHDQLRDSTREEGRRGRSPSPIRHSLPRGRSMSQFTAPRMNIDERPEPPPRPQNLKQPSNIVQIHVQGNDNKHATEGENCYGTVTSQYRTSDLGSSASSSDMDHTVEAVIFDF
jgi:hypothetical protein